jgi:hypothetical protein
MSIVTALRRLRQEDLEFGVSLGYTAQASQGYIVKPCLKRLNNKTITKK